MTKKPDKQPDIVERLRGVSLRWQQHEDRQTIKEAADEIERLRDALSQILDLLEGLGPNPYPVEAAEEIARAALKGTS
jgi:hypothetical protein